MKKKAVFLDRDGVLNNEESKVIAEIPQKLNYYTFKQLPKQEQYLIMKNFKNFVKEKVIDLIMKMFY